MAGRGSGIGLGMMGGVGVMGGSQTSTRGGALYRAGSRPRGFSNLSTHHYLWILVALEIGVLVLMRVVVFRHYHGG